MGPKNYHRDRAWESPNPEVTTHLVAGEVCHHAEPEAARTCMYRALDLPYTGTGPQRRSGRVYRSSTVSDDSVDERPELGRGVLGPSGLHREVPDQEAGIHGLGVSVHLGSDDDETEALEPDRDMG